MQSVQLNDIDTTADLTGRAILELVDEVSGLVSPPDVCIKLENLLRDESASADSFGDVIAYDPNLTAQILKLANSAHVSYRGRIDTVSRAVTVLGTSEILSLAYTAHAVANFSKIDSEITDVRTFWQHAAYVALIARAIAKQRNVLHPERLFVAGMLHDLGALILNHGYPSRCAELIAAAGGDEMLLARLEREAFGFDHAALGAALLERWQLPRHLCDAVRWHHSREMVPSLTEAAVLYVAEGLAALFGANFCATPLEQPDFPPAVLEAAGLSPDFDPYDYFDQISPEFVEIVYTLLT